MNYSQKNGIMSIKWKIKEYNREEEIEKSLSTNLVTDDFIFYDYKNNVDVTGLLVRRADMLIIEIGRAHV